MPTVISHALVPLALAVAAGPVRVSRQIAVAGAVLAMLPDADVAGFVLGVDYAADWGHRGATHSLALAALITAALAAGWSKARNWPAALFLFLAMASHGLLDMATDGGLGVALWWPVDQGPSVLAGHADPRLAYRCRILFAARARDPAVGNSLDLVALRPGGAGRAWPAKSFPDALSA